MADELPPLRWADWQFAVVTAAVTVGVCLFATFMLPGLLGYHIWLGMGDAKWTVESAQFVANGGLGKVYSINPQFLPLPGFLLILAPAVALGDHLGYANPYPFPLAHPSMWVLVAPVFFICGAISILGADYLAATLGVIRSRRRLLSVVIGLAVVLPTCCWAGHPEDLVAVALTTWSIALLLRQRYSGAAALLATAMMMQSWALLLIPIVVVATPVGRRLRVFVLAVMLPAATGLLLLALDFHDAFQSLVLQPMQGNGQHLPWWSLARTMTIMQSGVPDVVRVGSTSRLLAIVTAVGVAVAVRRDIRPTTVMLAASVALVARGAFETQVWCYYLAPAAIFLGLMVASSSTTKDRWTLGALAAFASYGFAAAGYNGYSLPPLLGLAILLAAAGTAVAMSVHDQQVHLAGIDLGELKIEKVRDLIHSSVGNS
jgi:hypothetical protein